jgi:hypothetical protein
MSINARARKIAYHTSAVIQQFDLYFTFEHEISRLSQIEHGFDKWQRAYSELWTEVAPQGEWIDDATAIAYEPFLRNMAVCLTFFQLLGQEVSLKAGFIWGTHLSPSKSPTRTDLDALLPVLPVDARKRILPDITADLFSSVSDILRLSPDYTCIPELSSALESICGSVGLPTGATIRLRDDWGFEVEDANFAAVELGISVDDVFDLVERRLIVSVPQWNGKVGFPTFQFFRNQIRGDVAFVLQNISDDFTGWRLALWLSYCVREFKTTEWYAEVLSQRYLWKPNWSLNGTGEFDAVSTARTTEDTSDELYRVTRREFTPFFFSAVSQLEGSSYRVSTPSGRFDLEAAISENGSLYMAATPEGACLEVLDRELVLTLEAILERCLWKCAPQEALSVADLTSVTPPPQMSTNRLDTRDLSIKMSSRYKGIKVGLRTSAFEFGYVFFGPSGAHLPAAAGLGVWSAEQSELVVSPSLWEYVEDRVRNLGDFPVIFRRFPERVH